MPPSAPRRKTKTMGAFSIRNLVLRWCICLVMMPCVCVCSSVTALEMGNAPCCEGMDPRFEKSSLLAPTNQLKPLFLFPFLPLPLSQPRLRKAVDVLRIRPALRSQTYTRKLISAPIYAVERHALGGLSMMSEGAGGGEAELAHIVQSSAADGTFVKASFTEYRGADKELKAVFLRPVQLKRGVVMQAVIRYKTNDQTKNHPMEDAGKLVHSLVRDGFTKANAFTTQGDYQLTATKKGGAQVTKMPGAPSFTEAEVQSHDRKKVVPVDSSSNFLRALGVSNAEGKPKPGMADKLRQIQKFVEIVENLVQDAGLLEGGRNRVEGAPLRVVDMGCGKGYLTFATHVHLATGKSMRVQTVGVEVRPDLVAKTNDIAVDLGLAPGKGGDGRGLSFVQGYIADHAGRVQEEGVDVLVALHACDTATDDAIFCGVKAGAKVIIAAPCCHKEFRRQMEAEGGQKRGVLQDLFRHGILREREAESATDAVRALLLEIAGYESKVFEFIGGEHTAKNTMITAVQGDKAPDATRLRERLGALMSFYGLRDQHLASLMGELPTSALESSANGKRLTKGKRAAVLGSSVIDIEQL